MYVDERQERRLTGLHLYSAGITGGSLGLAILRCGVRLLGGPAEEHIEGQMPGALVARLRPGALAFILQPRHTEPDRRRLAPRSLATKMVIESERAPGMSPLYPPGVWWVRVGRSW